MDIAKAILSEIEWAALFKRLTVYSLRLDRDMPAVFDGVSPEDLVAEAFVAYWGSKIGLNWDPNKGTLERFLCGVVKHKFLSHARRNRISAGTLESGLGQVTTGSLRFSTGPTTDTTMTDRIMAAARGDKALEELVEAAARLETEAKVNQQLSALLDTTIEDIVNRKRRLTRRVDRLLG